MKNKNIVSETTIGSDGEYAYAEFEQFETRLDCTREELLEANNLLRKFINLCEKKLKD